MNRIKLKIIISTIIFTWISPFSWASASTNNATINALYNKIAADQTSGMNLHERISSDPLEQQALARKIPGLFSSYFHSWIHI
jgi:hypothetical protein